MRLRYGLFLLIFILSISFASAIKNPSHYFNFDEASGQLIDIVASANFSSVNFNGQHNEGKLNYSYGFNGTGYLNRSSTPFGGDINGARAISIWIYSNKSTDYGIIYDSFDESNFGDEVIYNGVGSIIWRWHFNTLGSRDWQYSLGANNTWHNVFFALSSENPPFSGNYNCTLWVDGINTGISKRCEGSFTLSLPICIGTGVTGYLPSSCTGANPLKNIKLDEIASWQGFNTNSTFYDDTDAQFIYNNGTGRFWNGTGFYAPIATNGSDLITGNAVFGQMGATLCPNTMAYVINMIFFIILSLGLILIGFIYSKAMGVFGGLALLFTSFYISNCNGMIGLITGLAGVIVLVIFVFRK